MSNKKGADQKEAQEDRTENFYRLFNCFGAVRGDHYLDLRNRCSV